VGSLIVIVVVALGALVGFAVWRGRLVSIALAGAECPTCRVPLVPVPSDPADPHAWEVQACPKCDHLVTTVGHLPTPLAECPACKHPSLVVYAERVDGNVVVDEWCDLCGRRARTTLEARRPEPAPEPREEGRVLPFRRR
jgi:hypothetical protein